MIAVAKLGDTCVTFSCRSANQLWLRLCMESRYPPSKSVSKQFLTTYKDVGEYGSESDVAFLSSETLHSSATTIGGKEFMPGIHEVTRIVYLLGAIFGT